MKIFKRALPALALLAMALSAFGQDRKPLEPDEQSQYMVSAKAGAVNIVDGDVSFKRGKSDWDTLIAGDELRAGDAVKTASDGRVEVLLSPGSFLRLAGDSEFLFSSTSVYNLRLKVVRGSVIVEASAVESPIVVNAGQSRFSIVKDGIYRFTTEADGNGVAMVRKGRLLFADTTVKDGKKIVVLAGGTPMITSFDKKAQDEFDVWSKDRAKTLIAANRKLSERTIRRSLSMVRGGNLWLYDPFFRTYTFLPYGYGYNSPYGGGYRTCNPYNPWRNGYPAVEPSAAGMAADMAEVRVAAAAPPVERPAAGHTRRGQMGEEAFHLPRQPATPVAVPPKAALTKRRPVSYGLNEEALWSFCQGASFWSSPASFSSIANEARIPL